jgi:selenocysteine lyase/cysteine desulfurase
MAGPMSGRLITYAADQTHSSVARAARVLGFRPDQLRILPTDSDHRLRLDALAGAIEADFAAGRRPLVVCANAGATNTGAVDPLPEVAAICAQHGVWLHVDAAYGGFAALTDRGRAALAGLELADSVTLDPHKWLYQPIECGVYEWRSRALHDGVPMPAPMCTPPIIFGGAPQEGGGTAAGYGGAGGTWTGRDIPMMLHVFAHVVRGCVLEWWRRATGNSAALPADRPRLCLPSGSS